MAKISRYGIFIYKTLFHRNEPRLRNSIERLKKRSKKRLKKKRVRFAVSSSGRESPIGSSSSVFRFDFLFKLAACDILLGWNLSARSTSVPLAEEEAHPSGDAYPALLEGGDPAQEAQPLRDGGAAAPRQKEPAHGNADTPRVPPGHAEVVPNESGGVHAPEGPKEAAEGDAAVPYQVELPPNDSAVPAPNARSAPSSHLEYARPCQTSHFCTHLRRRQRRRRSQAPVGEARDALGSVKRTMPPLSAFLKRGIRAGAWGLRAIPAAGEVRGGDAGAFRCIQAPKV
eukprot:697308-Prorocentrum_minimum.AAC.1